MSEPAEFQDLCCRQALRQGWTGFGFKVMVWSAFVFPVFGGEEETLQFEAKDPTSLGVVFEHRSGQPGLQKRFMIECVGTGLGLIDVDGDGDLDLYLVQGGGVGKDGEVLLPSEGSSSDGLFLNDGTGIFSPAGEDCEVAEGFGFGVAAADIDGDDDLDLLVTQLGLNVLLLNQGEGRFFRAEAAQGLAGNPKDWSMGAAFGDIDGDGDLDCAVTNYLDHDLTHPMLASGRLCRWVGCEVPCGPQGLKPQQDRLYLNDGTGHFKEITGPAGLKEGGPAYSFQPVFGDFDGDRRADLFIAVDSEQNFLWRNLGKSDEGVVRFEEEGMLSGVALSDVGKEQAGMGVAVADIDGDGREDMVMTNFSQETNAFFHNASSGESGLLFFDEAATTGVGWPSYHDLGWGANLFDADLDGDLDLFVANGHVYPQVDVCDITETTFSQKNRLFAQEGVGRFVEVTGPAGSGGQEMFSSRGSVAGDLDGDGDLDLVTATLDGPPEVLINRSPRGGEWVAVELRPLAKAVGTRVIIEDGRQVQVATVRSGSSFLCAEPLRIHRGVAPGEKGLTVTLLWPDGREEIFVGLERGVLHRLEWGQGATR